MDRGDWQLVKSLMHAEILNNGLPSTFVLTLPVYSYLNMKFTFLTDFQKQFLAISNYLFEKFKIDTQDIYLSHMRADGLFAQTEFFISLESAYCRGMLHGEDISSLASNPLPGRFLRDRLGSNWRKELVRLAKLPNDDPIYATGLLGGSNHYIDENSKYIIIDFERWSMKL